MKKYLISGGLLLFSCAWLPAQQNAQSDAGAGSQTSGPVMIQGCLQSSEGRYLLSDKLGKTHEVTGEANKLRRLVGHEVQLTGSPATRTSDMTMQGSASSAAEIRVFAVKSVKDLAKTCTH
jgi:hypothetical protein